MSNMHLLPAADDDRRVADVIRERDAWRIFVRWLFATYPEALLCLLWPEAWRRAVEAWRDETAIVVEGWPS